MKTGEILTIVMIIWIIVPIIAAYLSARKKRDTNFWVFACVIFPPLVLFLLFLPKRDHAPTKQFGEEKESDDSFFPRRD